MNTNKKLKDYLDKHPGIGSSKFKITFKDENFKNDPVLDIPEEGNITKFLGSMSPTPEEIIKNIIDTENKKRHGF